MNLFRRCLLAAAMVLSLSGLASAGTVVLDWSAVTDADGYKIYEVPNATSVTGTLVTATPDLTTSITVVNGKHCYYATAYNGWGESGPSNVVCTPSLVGKPVLRLSVK